jgi:hypothetical protein
MTIPAFLPTTTLTLQSADVLITVAPDPTQSAPHVIDGSTSSSATISVRVDTRDTYTYLTMPPSSAWLANPVSGRIYGKFVPDSSTKQQSSRFPRHTREALFVDENTLRVNCGRCGKDPLITLDELRDKRVVDCDDCNNSRANHSSSK